MKLIPILIYLFTTVCIADQLSEKIRTVELPRPNSGTYSFEEAEGRKSEIFLITNSQKDFVWKNPYWGYGVHINKSDQIEIYGGLLPQGTHKPVKLEKLEESLVSLTSGNPMGVLITTELKPSESKSFEAVLNKLFKPSVQIYYKRQNQTH